MKEKEQLIVLYFSKLCRPSYSISGNVLNVMHECNACRLHQIISKQYGHCATYSFKCFTSLFGLISVWKTYTFLCATLHTSNCIYCYVFYLYLDITPHLEIGSGRKN